MMLPKFQLWIRFVAIQFFTLVLVRRCVLFLQAYYDHSVHWIWIAVWCLESGLFLGYLIAYLTRRHPKVVAGSLKHLLFPFIPALLPFFLILEIPDFSQFNGLIRFQPITHWDFKYLKFGLLLTGNLITLWALLYLRSSFSIASEARECVKSGSYKWISHPMYAGQFLTFLAVVLFRSSIKNWCIYAIFVCLQWIRLKNEEQVLKEAFSEYEEHRRSCWIRF